jgi:hypothetical protein
MKKFIPFAIAYDFDGTLAPGNMQERDFIPAIGMTKKAFWKEVGEKSKEHEADNILVYMGLMLEKAQIARVPVLRKNFENYGKGLSFFKGILPRGSDIGWFDRINKYGQKRGVKVEHYVISSGIREMVLGTPIAKKFEAVYASSFQYDHHGVPKWPALALNFTTKTQFLFRINKRLLNVYDNTVNKYVPPEDRPMPFTNMIFIGDGETDVPCFRLVKDQGGNSIAVYAPKKRGAKAGSKKLIDDHRVNYVAPADYRKGERLELIVQGIINKVVADRNLRDLEKP